MSDSQASSVCETSSRRARRRRMVIRKMKFGAKPEDNAENGKKRPRLEIYPAATSISRDCDTTVENCLVLEVKDGTKSDVIKDFPPIWNSTTPNILGPKNLAAAQPIPIVVSETFPKFGMASACGRRRDMEDAVAIHPYFCRGEYENTTRLHYFAVYDGHGCSHVRVV